MSKLELRKAMNGLGLSVDDDTLEKLIELYQGEEFGSAVCMCVCFVVQKSPMIMQNRTMLYGFLRKRALERAWKSAL